LSERLELFYVVSCLGTNRLDLRSDLGGAQDSLTAAPQFRSARTRQSPGSLGELFGALGDEFGINWMFNSAQVKKV
jgi:hypothetical protein